MTRVDKSNACTRTLLKAAEVLGGEQQLARRLGVSLSALQEWMRGEQAPPLAVFTQALDIVAGGPFGRTNH